MFRVRRDDQVVVISGKDRGKRGKVLLVYPGRERAVVEGMGLVKRHLRRSQASPQGAIISRESPLPLDRIQPVCPRCNRGVRVGFRQMQDGVKARVCCACKESF